MEECREAEENNYNGESFGRATRIETLQNIISIAAASNTILAGDSDGALFLFDINNCSKLKLEVPEAMVNASFSNAVRFSKTKNARSID